MTDTITPNHITIAEESCMKRLTMKHRLKIRAHNKKLQPA